MKSIKNIARAAFYSPYGFLRGPSSITEDWINELDKSLETGVIDQFDGGNGITLYIKKLGWDTDFFGLPIFRIEFSELPDSLEFIHVQLAFSRLREYLGSLFPEYYIFGEVPCEDTAIIAGMSGAGWRLIETRITCYRDDIQKFDFVSRSKVRSATEVDIPDLRDSAIEAVNIYDRFHADDFFTDKESDDFLAMFIENSVRGFADEVLVPADGPANAFLTGNYLVSPPSLINRKIGKMVLSAVTNARKGWYVRLIAELSFRFKEQGLDTVYMTTQATNRAVLKVWHRHGYQFGKCSHIFSTYVRDI